MNVTKQFTVTVRLGHCKRYTESDGHLVNRYIHLFDCPIIGGRFKEEGQPEHGDEIALWIHENTSGEEGIGSFDSLTFLTLNLVPAAFAEFWAGSAAADGMARDITIQFKRVEPPNYVISKAFLVEHLPGDSNENPKRRAGRPHPVVAELRDIRRAAVGSWRGAVTAFCVIVAFVLAGEILSAGIRAIWHVLQSH